ncbi:hypothetical protein [Fluviicola sp.]|uniref:hypothetical protein n=1 Tax=Fluviicola sp. TaxID=1917219 RepID=UPI003D26AF97
MRVAKLFAYLAICLLLPLWLFNLTDSETDLKDLEDGLEKLNEKVNTIKNQKDREKGNGIPPSITNNFHLDTLMILNVAQSSQHNDPNLYSRIDDEKHEHTTYWFSKNGLLNAKEIFLRHRPMKKLFLILGNLERDTASIYIESTSLDKVKDTIMIKPKNQIILPIYYFGAYYIKVNYGSKTSFSIPLIIEE